MARAFTRGGPRRKTSWGGFGNSAAAASLPGLISLTSGAPTIISTAIIVEGAAGFIAEEVTITRTIGMVTAKMGVATSGVVASIAVGLAVARNEAIAAGTASLPSPEDDPDFEWLYYAVFQLSNPVNALQDGPISAVQFPFDVRGQRILRRGETVVWIAESQTNDCFCGVGGRYLVKLS